MSRTKTLSCGEIEQVGLFPYRDLGPLSFRDIVVEFQDRLRPLLLIALQRLSAGHHRHGSIRLGIPGGSVGQFATEPPIRQNSARSPIRFYDITTSAFAST
jgi:hypothetical protein